MHFIYFCQKASHKVPEVVTITLNKPLNSGMGVSIVAAKVIIQTYLQTKTTKAHRIFDPDLNKSAV